MSSTLRLVRTLEEAGYLRQDPQTGLRSLAAPVRGRDGRVVTAVCVIVVRPDITTSNMQRDFLPALPRAAEAISTELGYASQCPGNTDDQRSVINR